MDVEMIFVMKRRQGDFGTGRNAGILKDTAPLGVAAPPRPAQPQVNWEQLSLVG